MRKFDLNRPDELLQHILSRGKQVGACFEWQGALNDKGYGHQRVGKDIWSLHRLSWVLMHGEIPKSLHVCHHCDNRKCFLIDHLFIGTNYENIQDAKSKGRHNPYKGEKHQRALLTENQVRTIYERYARGNITARMLSAQYGVRLSTVYNILYGTAWKHLNLKG